MISYQTLLLIGIKIEQVLADPRSFMSSWLKCALARLENPAFFSSFKQMRAVVMAYFLLQLVLAPFSLSGNDTYYYWEWSRHLALSYYDGPPLIAYIIRAVTLLLGDSLFALNLVAIVLLGACVYILYQTGRLFLTKETSMLVVLLWLFAPATTIALHAQTTYDNPQALCWLLTVYFVLKFIKCEQIRDFYFASLAIGFLLLSKYTGVVLVLGLVLFLVGSRFRYIFKTIHFYVTCLLVTLMVSPILLWNYQHDWVSVTYQLSSHRDYSTVAPLSQFTKRLFAVVLPVVNVLIVPLCFVFYKRWYRESMSIKLCFIVSLTVLVFYLLLASSVNVRQMWLHPYLNTAVILWGMIYNKGYLQKFMRATIVVYVCYSLFVVLTQTPWLYVGLHSKIVNRALIKQFTKDYPKRPKNILAYNWLEARFFFFLTPHGNVYTLTCKEGDGDVYNSQNQYYEWSTPVRKALSTKAIKEAYYIDFTNKVGCPRQYFDSCHHLKTRPYVYHKKTYNLYAYHCRNQ